SRREAPNVVRLPAHAQHLLQEQLLQKNSQKPRIAIGRTLMVTGRTTGPALVASCLLALATPSVAAERIGNFVLLDQHGQAHELHYHKDAKAIALMAYSSKIAGSDKPAKALLDLQAEYGDQVRFFAL